MNLLRKTLRSFENEESQSHLWMLPYCTLMMVLMILFSALYSHSYMNNSLEYETALTDLETPSKEMSRAKKEIALAQSLKDFINEMEMEGTAEINVTPHAIKLKLSSPVMFESGSAELTPFIMPLLIKLLEHLQNMDNTVIVEGHTDNVPIHSPLFRSNWELSAARAFSVIYFYIKRGIEPDRVVAHGYSEYRSLLPNTTDYGRALNRRIEITILRGGKRT